MGEVIAKNGICFIPWICVISPWTVEQGANLDGGTVLHAILGSWGLIPRKKFNFVSCKIIFGANWLYYLPTTIFKKR